MEQGQQNQTKTDPGKEASYGGSLNRICYDEYEKRKHCKPKLNFREIGKIAGFAVIVLAVTAVLILVGIGLM